MPYSRRICRAARGAFFLLLQPEVQVEDGLIEEVHNSPRWEGRPEHQFRQQVVREILDILNSLLFQPRPIVQREALQVRDGCSSCSDGMTLPSGFRANADTMATAVSGMTPIRNAIA